MCGERGKRLSRSSLRNGSSPRLRGTLEADRQEPQCIRFISACAGNVFVEHVLISLALHDVKQRHQRSSYVLYRGARQKSGVSLHNSRPRRFLALRRTASAGRSATSSARDLEGDRDDGFELVHVRDVISEALRFSGMNKADGGCLTRRENRRFGQTVKAGGRGVQAPVRRVGAAPIGGIVVAPSAVHGIFMRVKLTEPLDPRALHAAQLLDGSSLGSVFAKARRIHFSHDFQLRALVEGEARLREWSVGSCAAGPPRRVEVDTRFADPYDERSRARRQGDRRAADARAGLQGTDKLTGFLRPLTISDAGKTNSKENGDALEDHDRGHG